MRYTKAPVKAQKKYRDRYGLKFKAGQSTYKIVWCYDLMNDDGQSLCGMCHYQIKTVFIDIKLDEIQETLVHEIFHAEAYESGMKQVRIFHSDLEELCCEIASRVCKNFDLKKKKS